MTPASRVATLILPSAIGLGILGDTLLRTGPWGLNFAIWTAVLAGSLHLIARSNGSDTAPRFLLLLPVGFALCLAWRDAPFLIAGNLLAVFATLGLVALKSLGVRIRAAQWTEYVRGSLVTGINATFGPLLLTSTDLDWTEVNRKGAGRKIGSALLGISLASPLVLVFGGLLTSADPIFDDLVKATFDWDFGNLASHLLLIGFLTWIVAGYMRGLVFGRVNAIPRIGGRPSLGLVEIGIPLAALILVFSAFAFVQARYLFGGADLVVTASGLTYAEYARRGFFELVAVATLILPVLLLADSTLDKHNPKRVRGFRILASLLLVLVALIMDSALMRMLLYVDTFGLTADRFYATVFMIWIGVVLVLFVTTTLFGRGRLFALGSLVSGLCIIAALNVVNPDAWISRINISRAESGRQLDVSHLGRLSADATPFLVTQLSLIGEVENCELVWNLAASNRTRGDWRSWNLSRHRAKKVMKTGPVRSALRACDADAGAG